MTKAVDVMSRPVVSVTPDMPARAALVLLLEHGFAALPVVVEDRVAGVVSESDLLAAGMNGYDVGASVGDVMATPAVTMPMTASVTELASAMLAGGLRSVPIVDGEGLLVGMVGRIDLLRELVHDDDLVADRVRRVLHSYAGVHARWDVEMVDGVVWVTGPFADQAERRLVVALARTVPGVTQVELRSTATTATR
ncbi:MAG TPA: CBS domain-containing protein [Actinoplanes sp.]|nr:CBS domain-containing protein [Actinoplanes sp.]